MKKGKPRREKICQVCGLPFTWRRVWQKKWHKLTASFRGKPVFGSTQN
ncbi:DUF2256 domain-containing protein [Endozoicomonas gorgoniicola]